MNQYLYPWYYNGESPQISSILARNYAECLDKLSAHLINTYDGLDDTLEFDDLLYQLYELHGICIGDIYDITEFDR